MGKIISHTILHFSIYSIPVLMVTLCKREKMKSMYILFMMSLCANWHIAKFWIESAIKFWIASLCSPIVNPLFSNSAISCYDQQHVFLPSGHSDRRPLCTSFCVTHVLTVPSCPAQTLFHSPENLSLCHTNTLQRGLCINIKYIVQIHIPND